MRICSAVALAARLGPRLGAALADAAGGGRLAEPASAAGGAALGGAPRRLSTSAVPDVEAVVIGAGVVGLAIARQLAAVEGREVMILEAGPAIGQETSSRNSEVIHAGIYYPAGSLKARLCVEGRKALYGFCEAHEVPHARCGKLLVATTDAQLPVLRALQAAAAANGVPDLRWLTAAEVRALEPEVACVAGLFSPSTGILDSHAFMVELLRQAEEAGAGLALRSAVVRGELAAARADGLHRLVVADVGSGEESSLTCRLLVNAAGLLAQRVAASLAGLPPACIPRQWLAKGSYYTLSGSRAPFRHLIYPMPEPGAAGLGVHLTLDLGGAARFGPDVEWLSEGTDPAQLDYSVDPGRAPAFEAAIRSYWPGLPPGSLAPAYSGVRPKLSGPGQPAADFCVAGPAAHGVPGLACLYGIESPGLTASLALAEHAAAVLEGKATGLS